MGQHKRGLTQLLFDNRCSPMYSPSHNALALEVQNLVLLSYKLILCGNGIQTFESDLYFHIPFL